MEKKEIIKRFDKLSNNMKQYYVRDFTQFYQEFFGYSHAEALRKAKAAAAEQIALDIKARKNAQKTDLRKRTIAWLKIAQTQDITKRIVNDLAELLEKLHL